MTPAEEKVILRRLAGELAMAAGSLGPEHSLFENLVDAAGKVSSDSIEEIGISLAGEACRLAAAIIGDNHPLREGLTLVASGLGCPVPSRAKAGGARKERPKLTLVHGGAA